jgi:hypothetical protein
MSETPHPNSVRRAILEELYERYKESPQEMLTPSDLTESGRVPKEGLGFNIAYLADKGLVEVMFGYTAQAFSAARLTAAGVDLVEDVFAFNLQFPPPAHDGGAAARIPILAQRLVQEVDLVPVDAEQRQTLARDAAYVRDELARPPERIRIEAVRAILYWLEDSLSDPRDMPALRELTEAINEGVFSS